MPPASHLATYLDRKRGNGPAGFIFSNDLHRDAHLQNISGRLPFIFKPTFGFYWSSCRSMKDERIFWTRSHACNHPSSIGSNDVIGLTLERPHCDSGYYTAYKSKHSENPIGKVCRSQSSMEILFWDALYSRHNALRVGAAFFFFYFGSCISQCIGIGFVGFLLGSVDGDYRHSLGLVFVSPTQ